jgi:hypothetical protein
LTKLIKRYTWSIALYGAENWTLRKIYEKYLKSSEMWCCRRVEKISWIDRMKSEEVLHRVKEEITSYMQYKEGRLTELVISREGKLE